MSAISFAWLDQRVALSLLAGAQVMVVWFSRVIANAYREQALWLHAGNPLTGLATPVVFYERVRAVRDLIRRNGRPSVLLLVHIENLHALYSRFGPEVTDSAVLEQMSARLDAELREAGERRIVTISGDALA
ncbi:MAG: hypothetical protein LH617_14630 [Ramlibacter sp.]|nr:hypothetical protein [Ramlibacter sp.]